MSRRPRLVQSQWQERLSGFQRKRAKRVCFCFLLDSERVRRLSRAVQFLIFGDDIEQKVEIERGAPSGIFDVFASVRAEQIIGEGA